MAILDFADAVVRRFYETGRAPAKVGWAGIAKIALRKLDMLDYAADLADLASPPGNRLEALRGALAGSHSIRIDERWRIVFRWTAQGPSRVDTVDYH